MPHEFRVNWIFRNLIFALLMLVSVYEFKKLELIRQLIVVMNKLNNEMHQPWTWDHHGTFLVICCLPSTQPSHISRLWVMKTSQIRSQLNFKQILRLNQTCRHFIHSAATCDCLQFDERLILLHITQSSCFSTFFDISERCERNFMKECFRRSAKCP